MVNLRLLVSIAIHVENHLFLDTMRIGEVRIPALNAGRRLILNEFLLYLAFGGFQNLVLLTLYLTIIEKYSVLASCPVLMNGGSTGLIPIQVKIANVVIIVHSFIFMCGLSFFVFFFIIDMGTRITMDATRATTPPIFEGIDRRIAYANRKYHSGWMCVGVDRGFAWLKFSTSPISSGVIVEISRRIVNIATATCASLFDIEAENFILSMFSLVPVGFDDPVLCSIMRWTITIIIITIGVITCSEKNRVSVGWETEKFPHSHSTMVFPTAGITDTRFVITVAPQNDICPHGKTYPRNAVAIRRIRSVIPLIHVCFFVDGDENIMFRAMCA